LHISGLRDRDMIMDRVIRHSAAYHSSTSIYWCVSNSVQIGETFLWAYSTYIRMGHKDQLIRSTQRIGLSSVLRPRQHSIGYMGDGFYRSKDPTNSIKVLNEQIVHRQIKHTISRHEQKTQQVP